MVRERKWGTVQHALIASTSVYTSRLNGDIFTDRWCFGRINAIIWRLASPVVPIGHLRRSPGLRGVRPEVSREYWKDVPSVAIIFSRNPVEIVFVGLLEFYRVPRICHLNSESVRSYTKFDLRGKAD